MRIVSFVGQKGGVGKSALARVLATAAARRGTRVLVADFDLEQSTCLEWMKARMRNGVEPPVEVRAFKSMKKLRKADGDFDLAIADTRGFADDLTRDVAEESDVVFLPTGTSMDDLRPTLALAARLARHGAAGTLCFVLSRTGRSERQVDAAIDQVERAGYALLPLVWPLREGFQGDFDAGRAGSESANPHLRRTAAAVEGALLARVDHAR